MLNRNIKNNIIRRLVLERHHQQVIPRDIQQKTIPWDDDEKFLKCFCIETFLGGIKNKQNYRIETEHHQ